MNSEETKEDIRERIVRPTVRASSAPHVLVFDSEGILRDLGGRTLSVNRLCEGAAVAVVCNRSQSLLSALLDIDEGLYVTGVDLAESGVPSIDSVRLTRFRPRGRKSGLSVIVCPAEFAGERVWNRKTLSPGELMTWARNYYAFLEGAGLKACSSASALASQLFASDRFGDESEGKVPQRTNERLREYLPGVCAEYPDQGGKTHPHVYVLDQRSSHHAIAATTPVPDPNGLFVSLFFHRGEGMCKAGTPLYDRLIQRPGFFYLVASWTRRPAPWLPVNGSSAELPMWSPVLSRAIRDGSVHIHGISWCATSPSGWERTTRYAEFALGAKRDHPWLKRSLVASYGLMASVPKELRVLSTQGTGVVRRVPLDGRTLTVLERVRPPVAWRRANVAALGVIQAEMSMRTQEMMREVSSSGGTVTRVYADGFHYTASNPILHTDAWHTESLTSVHYAGERGYMSVEKVVRPGVSGPDIRRRRDISRLLKGLTSHRSDNVVPLHNTDN